MAEKRCLPSRTGTYGRKTRLSNFRQTGHPQEIGHIIAIVRPQGVHLVAKFQANRSNGSVCAGPSVLSGLPVRAGAGALTEILLSVNTPVPQQRGIWADLQNLTKCYAIRKPEVGEARNSQETLPTLSAACVEHQTGADIVGLAVPHVRRDAIDTFQSQHGGRVSRLLTWAKLRWGQK